MFHSLTGQKRKMKMRATLCGLGPTKVSGEQLTSLPGSLMELIRPIWTTAPVAKKEQDKQQEEPMKSQS